MFETQKESCPLQAPINLPIPAAPEPVTETPWWRKDLEASGITQTILEKMGADQPYVDSDPDHIWFDVLNNDDWYDCGPIKPRDLGQCLVFPYPGETFERNGETKPFARVKPQSPRLVGEFREWIQGPDGSQRKLTARERRALEDAKAGETNDHGQPCCGPSGYKVDDRRKPVKYESPRRLGQRLYDVIGIFHEDGLRPSDCLYLTEGEKKAICANANLRLKAYGLPGVTGAHDVEATHAAMDDGTSHYVLHPKIAAHCAHGGTVATLFDSPDLGKNPQVVRAQSMILRAVRRAGGKPEIAFIPDSVNGKKRGIDDYFVERGQEPERVLKALFRCPAPPFESLKSYEKGESSSAITRMLPRCLSMHAGAWFAHDRQALKKWVTKASKVFGEDEEQIWEWCNETARVCQETHQHRIIRDLERHGDLLLGPGDLRMDERTQEIYLGEELLRPDSAVTQVRANLSQIPNRLSSEPTRDDVRDAIRHIAERDQFHPVREYLEGLPPWDGTPRIEEAVRHLGIPGASQNPFHGPMLRKFLISAVARCYQPGCKVDTMLILHGPQGVRKSGFFQALCANPGWFTDQGFDVSDKDAVLTISRFWIVEWSELDNLRRASRREALKGFVTRRVDSVRPPYGKTVMDNKRSCVFAGTTNDDTFLEDGTGHRRFWIISDVENVDIPWVESNRDDLWAEAVAAYRANERWWLDEAEAQTLAELQRRHEVPSQWAEAIENYLNHGSKVWDGTNRTQTPPEEVTLSQVLEEAVGKPKCQQRRADQTEVADVLKLLGWTKDPSRHRSNGRTPIWRRPRAATKVEGCSQDVSPIVGPANCNGIPAADSTKSIGTSVQATSVAKGAA